MLLSAELKQAVLEVIEDPVLSLFPFIDAVKAHPVLQKTKKEERVALRIWRRRRLQEREQNTSEYIKKCKHFGVFLSPGSTEEEETPLQCKSTTTTTMPPKAKTSKGKAKQVAFDDVEDDDMLTYADFNVGGKFFLDCIGTSCPLL
jgi:hypothetical protein